MADLSTATATDAAADCCDPVTQGACCAPAEKAECCAPDASTCGCAAGTSASAPPDIRDVVRAKYAAAASGMGDSATTRTTDANGVEVWGAALYRDDAAGAPAAAVAASLGCGVPTAVADLHPGETVLDLGSGAGADALISAGRVGPTGTAIGIDMTDEMLDLARANARHAGMSNVEFIKGYLEELPLPDATVDVVISNCVINLAADKTLVLHEAARVLRPGGRLAVSDVIADPDLDAATTADVTAWTGCIAGALTEPEFRSMLRDAGFEAIEITPTHRVHRHAAAAIIRARIAGGP
jgi:SAM-dependent methyltransferase